MLNCIEKGETMIGGIIFCLVGGTFWLISIIYKLNKCALARQNLPTLPEFMEFQIDATGARDIRAMRIGAIFFFLFGLFGWAVASHEQFNGVLFVYFVSRILFLIVIYINVTMRLLINRMTGGFPSKSFPLTTELRDSFRKTGFFPDSDDAPSRIVRWTNIFAILIFLAVLFLQIFIFKI